jgi:hypothetical protein
MQMDGLLALPVDIAIGVFGFPRGKNINWISVRKGPAQLAA